MTDKKEPSWKLGEILIQKGWITWEQLDEALQVQNELKKQAQPQTDQASDSARRKPRTTLFLGEILIREGWLNWQQLSKALDIQARTGHMLGDVLLTNGLISKKNLFRALAIQLGMVFVDFASINIPAEVVKLVPEVTCRELRVMPLSKQGQDILVAISSAEDYRAELELKKLLPEFRILTALALPEEIDQAINRYFPH